MPITNPLSLSVHSTPVVRRDSGAKPISQIRVHDRGWERDLMDFIHQTPHRKGVVGALVAALGQETSAKVGLQKRPLHAHTYNVPVVGEPTQKRVADHTEYTYQLAPRLVAAMKDNPAVRALGNGGTSGVILNVDRGTLTIADYNLR